MKFDADVKAMRAKQESSQDKFTPQQQIEIQNEWSNLVENLRKVNKLMHNMKYNIKPFIAPE